MKWQAWVAAATLGGMALAAPTAAAQSEAAQVAQLKVAVVNTVQAIQQSEEAQAFTANLQQELAPEQTELQGLQQEIADLRQRVQDEGDVMSADEQRKVARDIENKQIDLEFRAQKLQKDVQDRQQELVQVMGPKVQAIVNDLVEVERYDLVFERSNVGYVNPRHDITAKVTEKLNERYAEAGQD
ncbi:MAG: OmpH family outer membrane protein [Gammaproteobacteria bacterium]|nr:OmpH family outer membrane protein [Gammaproteobacteria bacterium]